MKATSHIEVPMDEWRRCEVCGMFLKSGVCFRCRQEDIRNKAAVRRAARRAKQKKEDFNAWRRARRNWKDARPLPECPSLAKPHPNAFLVLEAGTEVVSESPTEFLQDFNFGAHFGIIEMQKALKEHGIMTKVVIGPIVTQLCAIPLRGEKTVNLPPLALLATKGKWEEMKRSKVIGIWATEKLWKKRGVDIKKTEHQLVEEEKEEEEEEEEKPFVCPFVGCVARFDTREEVKRHKTKHIELREIVRRKSSKKKEKKTRELRERVGLDPERKKRDKEKEEEQKQIAELAKAQRELETFLERHEREKIKPLLLHKEHKAARLAGIKYEGHKIIPEEKDKEHEKYAEWRLRQGIETPVHFGVCLSRKGQRYERHTIAIYPLNQSIPESDMDQWRYCELPSCDNILKGNQKRYCCNVHRLDDSKRKAAVRKEEEKAKRDEAKDAKRAKREKERLEKEEREAAKILREISELDERKREALADNDYKAVEVIEDEATAIWMSSPLHPKGAYIERTRDTPLVEEDICPHCGSDNLIGGYYMEGETICGDCGAALGYRIEGTPIIEHTVKEVIVPEEKREQKLPRLKTMTRWTDIETVRNRYWLNKWPSYGIVVAGLVRLDAQHGFDLSGYTTQRWILALLAARRWREINKLGAFVEDIYKNGLFEEWSSLLKNHNIDVSSFVLRHLTRMYHEREMILAKDKEYIQRMPDETKAYLAQMRREHERIRAARARHLMICPECDEEWGPLKIGKNQVLRNPDGEITKSDCVYMICPECDKTGGPSETERAIKAILCCDGTAVEESDAVRGTLVKHTHAIGPVERAWDHARQVAKINGYGDFTPRQLQKMKADYYDTLIHILRSKGGDPQRRKGVSELARQITKRVGKKKQPSTILGQMRIVFLSQEFLDAIDNNEISFSAGKEVSILYKTPEMMTQLELEVLNGQFTTVKDINARAKQYKATLGIQSKEAMRSNCIYVECKEDTTWGLLKTGVIMRGVEGKIVKSYVYMICEECGFVVER